MSVYRYVRRIGDDHEVSNRREEQESAPPLHRNKGAWCLETDAPPSFDPAWQACSAATWIVQWPEYDENGWPVAESEGTVSASYEVTPRPAEAVLAERLAALAEYRWQKEMAGKAWNGATLDTTDRGKGLLLGALTRLQRRPEGTTTPWKLAPGVSIDIDLATAEAAFDVVADYVDALFAKEADHAAGLVAAAGISAAAVGTYDFTTGWPS